MVSVHVIAFQHEFIECLNDILECTQQDVIMSALSETWELYYLS